MLAGQIPPLATHPRQPKLEGWTRFVCFSDAWWKQRKFGDSALKIRKQRIRTEGMATFLRSTVQKLMCLGGRYSRLCDTAPLALTVSQVLLHAGDFTMKGEVSQAAGSHHLPLIACPSLHAPSSFPIMGQVESFSEWLKQYPAREKIVIAGNHDLSFEPDALSKWVLSVQESA